MIRILRMAQGSNTTLSHLYFKDIFMCYLLEDSIRDTKIYGETCIPEGKYPLRLNTTGGMNRKYKNRFPNIHRGMLEISEIPNYSFIYIHIGNTHKDTLGCPLTGRSFNFSNGDYSVVQSTVAYQAVYSELLKAIDNGENQVEVINRLKI